MAFSKPSHGERDASSLMTDGTTSKPTGRLYLIFDDYEFGYSIRELNLLNADAEQRRLPPPFICLKAQCCSPDFFTGVGTKILATHPREDSREILPVIDARSRHISFAPGELYPQCPIYLPVGDKIFALDMDTFKMLSMKPLCWPPQLEDENEDQISDWSWRDLPLPTFNRMAVTSYAVDSVRQTIFASTDAATFAFDPVCKEWEKRAEWSLPFSGRAYFVHDLNVFVGLPKDGNAFGHLCFCRWLGGDDKHDVWFSKDNLSNKRPAETHVGTTLVYLGESRFCIVECVRNGDDKAHTEEGEGYPPCCFLTTFSLSSDTNGVLTTAKTAMKCYRVPRRASFNMNPVAFWL